jgi:glycogen debranching enzyme
LLDRDQGRRLLALVEKTLLTPMGLRTLAPDDPQYRGRYGGDQRARDSAYHQGTVWPWLLGPYADAVRYVEGDGGQTNGKIQRALAGVVALRGQIPEIADGDPPHAPNGCPAQAWSVGEVARVWMMSQETRDKRQGTRDEGRGTSKTGRVTRKGPAKRKGKKR